MKFGEYIKKRRKELGLTQEEIGNFGQAYIANIEAGRKRPAKRDTIVKLAKALQLREDQVTWLWVYSMLNEEPTSFFERYGFHDGKSSENPGSVVREQGAVYPSNPGTNPGQKFSLGMSLSEVRAKFGDPDKTFQFGNQRKWIYQEEGIHVLFENDQVVDVVFK